MPPDWLSSSTRILDADWISGNAKPVACSWLITVTLMGSPVAGPPEEVPGAAEAPAAVVAAPAAVVAAPAAVVAAPVVAEPPLVVPEDDEPLLPHAASSNPSVAAAPKSVAFFWIMRIPL